MLGVQNEREWRAMCDIVLRDPALAQDPRYNSNSKRSAARQELKAVLDSVFKHLDRDELILRLDEAKIANAKVNDMAGLWAHPQLQARGRWRDIETPAGQVPALLPPGQTDAHMGPIPRVGQHNQSILAELGMADAVIAA
jgi:crotonobetainyl-CoA:carnitine CoA-transferase CaiB-like acyl-CoA transferase